MKQTTQKFFLILLVLVISIGVFFRCYNLDRKVYWHDEVYTSIRTAGYNGDEVKQDAFNNKLINSRDLLKYQSVTDEKTWQDSWAKLLEHPEHPPLYYLLSRAWQQLFGSSLQTTRSLSVLFGILLLPAVYWLCWELFKSHKIGLWAVGVIAISPVHIIYSQEAREYSLLLLTSALNYTALIGAVNRKKNWWWWGFYALSLATNFYVSLLAGYLAIAQAVYIAILEKLKITKITVNFVIAGIISLLLFAPWLQVIYLNLNILKSKTSWTNMVIPFFDLLGRWELHLTSIFIDLHPNINGYISARIIGFLLVAIAICFWFLAKRTQPKTWLFLFVLTVIPALMLMAPDLIKGGIKSIMTRYFLPSLLTLQLVVVYWLASFKEKLDVSRIISLALIMVLGVTSCVISAQELTWWNKIDGYNHLAIAKEINNYPSPLLITNNKMNQDNRGFNIGNFLSISHLIDSKVSLILFTDQNVPVVNPQKFSDVLLWNVGEETIANFTQQNNCELKQIEGDFYPSLWIMQTKTS